MRVTTIYPNLKQLAAEAGDAKTEKQKGKPDRQIYSITPAEGHLEKWLAVSRSRGARNELLLKLFFGAQRDRRR